MMSNTGFKAMLLADTTFRTDIQAKMNNYHSITNDNKNIKAI